MGKKLCMAILVYQNIPVKMTQLLQSTNKCNLEKAELKITRQQVIEEFNHDEDLSIINDGDEDKSKDEEDKESKADTEEIMS